jgi:argininosuccinate synthase
MNSLFKIVQHLQVRTPDPQNSQFTIQHFFMASQKIAVAYSGGLDTSVMVHWLRARHNADIVAVTGNIGHTAELPGIAQKAKRTGAKSAVVVDAREEFITDYCFPALRAGALYEGAYPMATALGRPLLAKILAEAAVEHGCSAVAHGCTGKGNDQVRFEVVVNTLAPQLKVMAPLREPGWDFPSRESEIEYAQKYKIPVIVKKKNPYSIDANLWGVSIECGILEDPTALPPADAYQVTSDPATAPAKAARVAIGFERGTPVSLNGKKLSPVALVLQLSEIAGKHGIGRLDMIENRLVGIKSREIYEAPAAMTFHAAHKELERLTLDRMVMRELERIAPTYADLVYNGLWFTPLRTALDAFVAETQRPVTGTVELLLNRGRIQVASRISPYSLYDKKLATYTNEDSFRHDAAAGFIHLWGLPVSKAWQMRAKTLKRK